MLRSVQSSPYGVVDYLYYNSILLMSLATCGHAVVLLMPVATCGHAIVLLMSVATCGHAISVHLLYCAFW
jgi:hypothetical protein